MANTSTGLDALGYRLTHVGDPVAATDGAPRGYVDLRERSATPPLHAFRRQLARRFFEPVNILCVGTSTTFGTNASTVETNYVSRLAQSLRGRYTAAAVGGWHYLPTHQGWTTRTGASNVNKGYGLASMSTASGTGVFARTVANCTGFRVYFKQGTGAGVMSVKIDAGGAVNWVNQQGTGGCYDGVYEITGLTAGSHTITITWISGTPELEAVYAFSGDETSGIRTFNGGTPAYTAANWISSVAAAQSHWARAGKLDPSLMIYMIGTNDFTNQVALATFKANVADAINTLRMNAKRSCSVLLLLSYLRFDSGSPTIPYTDYGAQLAALSTEMVDVDYLDLSGHFPTGQLADEEDLIFTDGIHCTDAGYAWLADIVADHICARVNTATIPTSVGAAVSAPDPVTLSGLVSDYRASDLTQTDGLAIASWPRNAAAGGVENVALAQATGGNQPILKLNQVGSFAAVTFRQTYGAGGGAPTGGTWMRTAAFATPLGEVLTVAMVARIERNYGNVFNSINTTKYLGMALGTDMTMAMYAGAAGAGGFLLVGGHRWAVYVLRFNTTSSRLDQSGWPQQSISLASHANAGLLGLTLSGNNAATTPTNTGNFDVAELALWNRALTDGEAFGVIEFWSRKYNIDRVGRTSV